MLRKTNKQESQKSSESLITLATLYVTHGNLSVWKDYQFILVSDRFFTPLYQESKNRKEDGKLKIVMIKRLNVKHGLILIQL